MKRLTGFGLVLLFLTGLAGAEDRFSLQGYYKNFSIVFKFPRYKSGDTPISQPDMGAVTNRLRLKLFFRPSNRLSFQLDYDLSPRIQDRFLFGEEALFGGLKPLEYRISDFRSRIYPPPEEPVSSFGLFHNVDRFYLTIKTEFADIFVGRQAVAWGSARVINPTDILVPFAFNELDKEERRGVDAVRVKVPLGMMDELDFGFVAGKDLRWDKNAFFLRGKIYTFRTDLSLLLIAFRKHFLVGVDMARALGGAGFWVEAAYVIPGFFQESKASPEKNYVRASVGADYNLTSKTYGFIEYHFNSAGRNNPQNYPPLFASSAYQDGAVYLLGQHYLNLGTTYQLSPLMPVTGLVILNLNDRSLVLAPLLEYSVAENIYLAAGGYLGLGKNPQSIQGLSSPLRLRSEFGTYPDMLFTSFRVYF
ncbi:MAG: hypothetical protein ACLFVG_03110 [Candidatus Aminicenantes bacterium]